MVAIIPVSTIPVGSAIHIVPSSCTGDNIFPKCIPLNRLNVYHIINLFSSKLAGCCSMTILSCAIQSWSCFLSVYNKSGVSGKFCPQSSGGCGGILATCVAMNIAFANCMLIFQTSSPESYTLCIILSTCWQLLSSVPSSHATH